MVAFIYKEMAVLVLRIKRKENKDVLVDFSQYLCFIPNGNLKRRWVFCYIN